MTRDGIAAAETAPRPGIDMLMAAVVSVVLTALMLGTVTRPGHVLARDFVTVPDPVVNDAALGMDGYPPRAVPLDLVSALLAHVVPTSLQQRGVLLLAVLASGIGLALLVRRMRWAAPVAAAAGIWNPFVVERLLLGQAPTMLAYTAIPWLVLAAASHGRLLRRVVLVALVAVPAAVTPWGSLATILTLGVVLLHARRGWRDTWILCVPALLTLPWLIAALTSGVDGADQDGAAAFAPRPDSPGGVILSVMTHGGVWAQGAHLASRQEGWALLASAALIGLACYGAAWLWRSSRRNASLIVAGWLIPIVTVLLLATPWAIEASTELQGVPGFGLIRDVHRLLAWSVAALAILVATGVSGLLQRVSRVSSVDVVGPALMLVAVSLSVLTVPDAGGRLRELYRPTEFPQEWSTAVQALPDDRPVLVLPWQTIRAPSWNDGRPFVDPLPLAARSGTVRSTTLSVDRGGAVLLVDDGEPAEAARWRAGQIDSGSLDAHGIQSVFVCKDTPGHRPESVPGFALVHDGPYFAVWRRQA